MKSAYRDLVGRAHDIARGLEEADLTGPEALMILGIAMGLFVEGVDGSHREMLPLADALVKTAQQTFDSMRAARVRGEFGHA